MNPAERDASYWIETLGLVEHPEGGYFRETYRSAERLDGAHLPKRFGGERHFSFEIGDRSELLARYPLHCEVIERLTK